MRVHSLDDLSLGSFELTGEDQLRKQFGDVLTDHMRAQQFTILLVEDELHETIALPGCQGTAAGLEGELADLDIAAGFSSLLFGHTHARDLRMSIGAAGNVIVIDR